LTQNLIQNGVDFGASFSLLTRLGYNDGASLHHSYPRKPKMARRKTAPQDEPQSPAERFVESPRKKVQLNRSQQAAWGLLEEKPIVLFIGPAGTGKSFAAMAWGAQAIRSKRIEKIVFIRSPLEMGRSRMGYLPGTADEKMAPYLDSVMEIARKLGLPSELIEVRPLPYIQGATFENALVFVDECQNLNSEEFLATVTRLGIGSTMVLAGDAEQDTRRSFGLKPFIEAVKHLGCVGVQEFTEDCNMRHPAIIPVIKAYRAYNERIDNRND
jgi:phosphate starvation-inducible PhoH-like protein